MQITLSGQVTQTNGGQPIGGLSMDLGGVLSLTDAGGGFSSSLVPEASLRLLLTGAGSVPRSLMVGVRV